MNPIPFSFLMKFTSLIVKYVKIVKYKARQENVFQQQVVPLKRLYVAVHRGKEQ